jgi:hypothetical protein
VSTDRNHAVCTDQTSRRAACASGARTTSVLECRCGGCSHAAATKRTSRRRAGGGVKAAAVARGCVRMRCTKPATRNGRRTWMEAAKERPCFGQPCALMSEQSSSALLTNLSNQSKPIEDLAMQEGMLHPAPSKRAYARETQCAVQCAGVHLLKLLSRNSTSRGHGGAASIGAKLCSARSGGCGVVIEQSAWPAHRRALR